MVQLIIAGTTGNLVPNGTFGHIQPERPLSADRVALHPNQLDPADAGVLPRVFCEALRFSKVILPCRIVWLQNVHDIFRAISADNQEIRIGRFCLTVDLIRNAQRP